MDRHIQNALKFGVNVVVAVNSFATDTPAEVELIRQAALRSRCDGCGRLAPTGWTAGAGAVKLAEAVIKAAEQPSHFHFLYPLELSIKEKLEMICKEIYGAAGIEILPEAQAKIELYTRLGFDKLPLCMAKTHLSFTHDAAIKGAPSGFIVPVRDIRASVGAGFLYPLLGEMRTMPGLPTRPVFYDVDLDLELWPGARAVLESGVPDAHLHPRPPLAARLLALPESIPGRRAAREPRVCDQGPALRLPDVRQLPAAGDGLHLPDGMSQGTAQRPLRRFHARALLRGRDAAVHLVQDLRALVQDGPGGEACWRCCRRWTGRRSAPRPGRM